MNISMIVAVGHANAIGCDGKMPWHIKAEMEFFRAYTSNKVVVMGAVTAESIGTPLGFRHNIAVSKTPARVDELKSKGFDVVGSLQEAFDLAASKSAGIDVVLMGGSRIYEEGLEYASVVWKSLTYQKVEDADAFFPALPYPEWHRTDSLSFKEFTAERFEKTTMV